MKTGSDTHDGNVSAWLFVCYGNICRSPIAEHLARRLLPPGALVDSAGTHAWATEPAAETVAVMRALYGIDISNHRPKNLTEAPLQIYDQIFGLSAEVASFIRANFPSVRDKVIRWDIEDPYQGGAKAFERCARHIETRLDLFFKDHGRFAGLGRK